MQIYFCLQVWEPKSMKVHLSTSMKLLGKLYLIILLFLWTASIKNVDLADLRSRFRYREQKPSSNFDIFILIGLARRHNKVVYDQNLVIHWRSLPYHDWIIEVYNMPITLVFPIDFDGSCESDVNWHDC